MIHPPCRSILPIWLFQQLVSEQGSHKEKPNILEKRSEDGSFQTWEDHRELGDWCAPHSTQLGGSHRRKLRKSLKRRKDIAIAKNDRQYKEIDNTKAFSNGDSK